MNAEDFDPHYIHCYRTTYEVVGADRHGNEVKIGLGTLVQVLGPTFHNKSLKAPSQRFRIMVCKRSGRVDPQYISYDGAWPEMLSPEPGVICWPYEYDKLAAGQGWNIFSTNGAEGHDDLELSKIDEIERWDRDEKAWEFVWERAVVDKCPVSKRALEVIYYHAPKEYANIRAHCTKNEEKPKKPPRRKKAAT